MAMKLFKSHTQQIDEMTKYGFELAIKYAEIAEKHGKDPISYMKQILNEWEDK